MDATLCCYKSCLRIWNWQFKLEKSHALLQDRHGVAVPLMTDKVLTALTVQLSRIQTLGTRRLRFMVQVAPDHLHVRVLLERVPR